MEVEFTKEDQNTIKLYFSSLTARKANVMYANLGQEKNHYILTNMEPSKLIKYCDATFSAHLLIIKNRNINKIIRKIYKWLEIPKIPFVLKITDILSLLNKFKWSIENIKISIDDNFIICADYTLTDKKGVTKEEKMTLAYPLVVYPVNRYLTGLYDTYSRLKLEEIINNPMFINKDIPNEIIDNIVSIRFDFKEFGIKDAYINHIIIPLIDGAETISNKEFMKKIKSKYQNIIVAWKQAGCIEYGTVYSDDFIELRSIRPHVRIYVKQKKKKGNK